MKFAAPLLMITVLAVPVVLPAQSFVEVGADLIETTTLNSRSASLADIDNDGDLDLLIQGSISSRKLYRNNLIPSGTLGFTNVQNNGGIVEPDTDGWSAAWADYDGDGWLDVFLGQSNRGSTVNGDLFRNNGDGTFENVTDATEINDFGFHQNVAWADMNSDGMLDVVIGMEGPQRHEIWVQQTGGTFQQFGAIADFQKDPGVKGYGMAIGDADGDGDLDVYISTCNFSPNLPNAFYENQLAETGEFKFVEIAEELGLINEPNSYGTEFHDFDNDGDLDLFMTGADGEPSKIWRNDGKRQWVDVDTILDRPVLSNFGGDMNGARVIDYDNDGDLDLYFHDHLTANGNDRARWLFRNDGNWNFTDVTEEEGLDEMSLGAYDSTFGDLDLDGDLDLVFPTQSGFPTRIFESNVSTNGNHWLMVKLMGNAPNTTAIGAQLYATLNQGTPEEVVLRRDMSTNAGTFNQSVLPVHFGLGDSETIDELRVVWPNGLTQTLPNVEVDRYLTIRQAGISESWILE